MKKRIVTVLLAICFLFSVCSVAAAAAPATGKKVYYEAYTAIGDSICAGFSQIDYEYINGFNMMENIENCPQDCYVSLVGEALGGAACNLGKCGCDTTELLDILTNTENEFYGTYQNYIGPADLLSLEMGSDDLIMAVVDSIYAAAGLQMTHEQGLAMFEPLLTGDAEGIIALLELAAGSSFTEAQIAAIGAALSDDALSATLASAYGTFCTNFPLIIDALRAVNGSAELVVLNYYNPYENMNFSWGDTTYNTGSIVQTYTDQMNAFVLSCCTGNGLIHVDISDTPTNGLDPHPTTEGHKQIAGKIVDALLNTITAAAQAGGTITPSGQIIVENGRAVTFEIEADSGYVISDVVVDGVSVGAMETYTFTGVGEDHTITAKFLSAISFETYTAYGDSITAGFSLDDYQGDFSNPSDCYAAVSARMLQVGENYNDALLGHKTADLLNALTDPENSCYAQFTAHLTSSDLVSLAIGSNDLTMTMLEMILECLSYPTANMTAEERAAIILPFLNGATLENFFSDLESNVSGTISSEQITAILTALMDDSLDARLARAYEEFKVNWDAIIEAVREINPDATLAAVGYYNPFPTLNFEYEGVTYNIGTVSQKYVDRMNAYISGESDKAGEYVFVDTTGVELYATSGALSIDPHPTKAGHAEIAKRLVDALYNNTSPNDPGVYIPIVIPYFSIEARASEGGSVSPEGFVLTAYGGDRTFSFIPDEGYEVECVLVDGELVETSGSYVFINVIENHSIYVSFIETDNTEDDEDDEEYENPFDDVAETDWFYDNVMSVYAGGIMTGMSEKLFKPYFSASRAMIAQILYRLESEPYVQYQSLFTDVLPGEWYTDAVIWAAENGVAAGFGNGDFKPDDMVTREQMVTILFNYAKYKGYDTGAADDLSAFADTADVSDWALTAMRWAVASGLIQGNEQRELNPGGEASRAEIAAVITRFMEQYLV